MQLNAGRAWRWLGASGAFGIGQKKSQPHCLRRLSLLARQQSVDGRVELIAALEEFEFENEKVAKQLAAEFLDQVASSRGRPACRTPLARRNALS